jgi:hypothetical protein
MSFATWDELKAHLSTTFGLLPAEDQGFVRFAYTAGGLSERVGVFRLRAHSDREWVAIALKIAPTVRIRAAAALIKNYELPIGALCFANETLIVRQTLPINGLTVGHLDQTITALMAACHQARSMLLDPESADDNPFDYLVR